MPKATTFQPLPACLSSTALTALEPMSRPITALDFRRPNTWRCPLNPEPSRWAIRIPNPAAARPPKSGAIGENRDHAPARRAADDHRFVSDLQSCGSGISVIPRSPYRRGAGPTAHVIGRAAGRLDTPQKHPYDLGLPLPGPARP